MDILRSFIRGMVTEAALGLRDMPEGFHIEIRELEPGVVVVQLVDSNDERIVGEVGMEVSGAHGSCSGAWVVSSTHAKKGWGPLLYDVAIEYATMHGPGLTPDRESVSDDAYRVWDYYLNRRSDVKVHQLDSKKNILTPSPSDNCTQMAAATHAGGKFENEVDAEDLKKSPLSKYYSKAPMTINALKAAGKIRIGQ